MATDKNKHLECVHESHKISKEEALLNKHLEYRKKVKEVMEAQYSSRMYAPFNSGSYAKNTAINTKFDFDMMVPFKRNAFDTLKQMYEDVFSFLSKHYAGAAKVRPQKVSVGLEFYDNGDTIKIDVVPGRELKQDEFDKDKRLNLYVYERFGKIEAGADYLLTNVHEQIKYIRDRADAEKDSVRKIIRLLKVWKVGQGVGPKSFFLELITLKAFDSKNITGDLWEKLKAFVEFILDNAKTVTLSDPGNGGNNVADTMTDAEKDKLVSDMKALLEMIEQNSDNIKYYFRINTKHPCEDKSNSNTYGIKKDEVSKPPATRFG